MSRPITLRMILIVVALLLVSGAVTAQDETNTFQLPVEIMPNRISFTYSRQIAQGEVWQWVPASSDVQTPTGPVPEYTQVTFQNYADDTGWVDTGQIIYVYPLVTFPTDTAYPFAQGLASLRTILAERPTMPQGVLPMLPIVTASQILCSQFQYLDFSWGAGIRYVTAAGLDVSPLSDQTLFYTFQGLTSDGAYYVAAIFPLQSSLLPDTAPQMTTEEYNQFVASFDTYLGDVTQQLNGLPPQDYSPNLNLLDGLFASLQIASPAATILTPAGATMGQVAYDNVTFSYDAALASRIEIDVIPPFVDPGGMNMFGSEPGYTAFSLIGFPKLRPSNSARLRVIPVDTFPASGTAWDQQLDALLAFLAAHDPLTAQSITAGETPIPMLPLINAAQVIVAKPVYLDFQNGMGVRFITFYSQGINPITNELLLYSFIGMTADGKHVVSAEFPVTAPVLPDIDYGAFDYDAFAANYADYLARTLGDLDALEETAYTPNLAVLDQLISSVNVGG